MTTGFGFASIAPMHSPRAFAAAVGLANNAKVLVTGGGTSDGPFSAELYDDSTRTWSHSEMTTVRSRHTTTVLKSGQVLVAGGDNSTDPGTAEVYNPNTNSWQKVFSNLHSPRIAHTATLLADGRILVSGGLPATFGPTLNSVEMFDPGTDPVNGTWTVANPMNEGRAFNPATLLPNGTMLVAGGLPDSSQPQIALSTAELFDPATGIWTRTSPMNDTHSGHTATLLALQPLGELGDFVVLVAGGVDSLGDIGTSAELYNPPPPVVHRAAPAVSSGGSWVRIGVMNVPRMFHTATLLPAAGGPLNRTRQVLVAGGGPTLEMK